MKMKNFATALKIMTSYKTLYKTELFDDRLKSALYLVKKNMTKH